MVQREDNYGYVAAFAGVGYGDAAGGTTGVVGELAIALAFLATKELSIIAKPVI